MAFRQAVSDGLGRIPGTSIDVWLAWKEKVVFPRNTVQNLPPAPAAESARANANGSAAGSAGVLAGSGV
jgi:hypothetical protein